MKTLRYNKWIHATGVALLAAMLQLGAAAQAGTISQIPLFVSRSSEPLVMLSMSNDHQMFYKAYDDWTDFDGDGVIDTNYLHDVDHPYYGYFDSFKCYDHNGSYFEPKAYTSTMYCDGVSGGWSGNFLNWATMARIDTVRKMLYGGKRSTDTNSSTILERTFLPTDAHGWAKYYNGADLAKLTPFDQSDIDSKKSNNEKGNIDALSGISDDEADALKNVYDGIDWTGITICNTTFEDDDKYSQDVTEEPQIRVVAGNFSLWGANERWQCTWLEEQERPYNNNDPSKSDIKASSRNPSAKLFGLGSVNYTARVKVCVDGLETGDGCKEYPDGNLKPIGLLQTYGEADDIYFGLMTGSYGRNKSGGVLRKNASSLLDEINYDSDGTFKSPPSTGNIIGTLDALRIYGYYYGDGTYDWDDPTQGDNCPWAITGFNDGDCTNWGNPQAELYLETLRYLAGESATGAFNTDDSSFLSGLKTASWSDPMPAENWCSNLSVINFNASVVSYDADQLGGASDIGISDLDGLVDKIGDAEGITGKQYFIGENGSDNNQQCTKKTVNNLSDVRGTCPDAPRLEGSYKMAGLAFYANTTDIRSDRNDEQKVKTYGVSMAPALPQISIPNPLDKTKTIEILPACRTIDWENGGTLVGNCAIVDFKVITASATYGKFYVNWEDGEQGGDYDQDAWGMIEYDVSGGQIKVTTDIIGSAAALKVGFGYVIAGTTQDGFHMHSGAEGSDDTNGYTFSDPSGVTDCNDCKVADGPTSHTYAITTNQGEFLEQPMWYASKYGGFTEDEDDANGLPDQAKEWDTDFDGQPDNYFFAINPTELASDLSTVFQEVAKTKSSAASVVANSVTLETNTFIYQAQFSSGDWSGDLLAIELDPNDGSLIDPPDWQAQTIINNQDPDTGREIITFDPVTAGDGVPFRWADIDVSQQDLLDLNPVTGNDDNQGAARLAYLRGDRSDEDTLFRPRDFVLGDIVDSTPFLVQAPRFTYPCTLDAVTNDYLFEPSATQTYCDFKASYADRPPVIYVGANDGMLHAVDGRASDDAINAGGDELFAYVPNLLFDKLNELTGTTYTHEFYVNGAPTAVDVLFDSDKDWHTALVGSLGAGGKGYFALDVTDPSKFDEANAADIALWEYSAASDDDLGFSFGQPAIAKMHDGKWRAILANGYDSVNGDAVLLILDIETGAVVRKITTGSGDASDRNGMSTPAPVDVDGDFVVDYIYAGDLHGNMWKFDVGYDALAAGNPSDAADPTKWGVAFSAKGNPAPLFAATDDSGDRQPITERPDVSLNPNGVGYQILFGTGKYYETNDDDPSAAPPAGYASTQSFYGIIDQGAPVEVKTTRDKVLLEQTVDYEGEITFDSEVYNIRVTSDNKYAAPASALGWFMDLPTQGERVVARPILNAGRIIFVSLIPSTSPCEAGGSGWLMELNAADGSRLNGSPFDLNNDGNIDAADLASLDADGDGEIDKLPVTGKESKVGIIQAPTILKSGTKEYKYASGSKGGQIEVTLESAGDDAKGRMSWQQLR
jgi:type IV pilus assembly protein PilY1